MWQRYNQTTHIFEKSTNDGASWTPLGLSADIITEGVFNAARIPASGKAQLPSSVAYEDETNDFQLTQYFRSKIFSMNDVYPQLEIRGTTPLMQFYDASGGADAKIARIYGYLGALTFDFLNDAQTVSQASPLQLYRSGVIRIGGNIQFPATPLSSTGANDFDDFEEGTWLPALGGESGSQTGQTYNNRIGKYIKIGRFVYCSFYISILATGSGGGGNLIIVGLPFYNDAHYTSGVVSNFQGLGSGVYSLLVSLYSGLWYCYLPATTSLTASTNIHLGMAHLTTGTQLIGFFCYLAQS